MSNRFAGQQKERLRFLEISNFFTTEDTEFTEDRIAESRGSLCELCVLCGEFSFLCWVMLLGHCHLELSDVVSHVS